MIPGSITIARVNHPKVSLDQLRNNVGKEVLIGVAGEGTIRCIIRKVKNEHLIIVDGYRSLSGSVSMEEKGPNKVLTQGQILFIGSY